MFDVQNSLEVLRWINTFAAAILVILSVVRALVFGHIDRYNKDQRLIWYATNIVLFAIAEGGYEGIHGNFPVGPRIGLYSAGLIVWAIAIIRSWKTNSIFKESKE